MQLLTVSAVGAALLLSVGVVNGLAADKTIEGTNSALAWGPPSTAEVNAGGTVEFKNTSTITPHGLSWQSPPATPSCPGVPSTPEGQVGPWSSTCTFTQAGTYNFVCSVHPAMTGTVTVRVPTPIVNTSAATEITQTGAKLNGSVNPSGQPTTYWFKYGTTAVYDHETTPHEPLGFSDNTAHAKSVAIAGLAAATTYHFRMFADNASGTTSGSDLTFTTAGPPSATTDPATGLGSIEATLKGTVNPRGLATTYYFKYGTTAVYDHETTGVPAGSGTVNVPASAKVTGLSPSTTYHFQVVAENSAGETEGADRKFTTSAGPVATTGQAAAIGETAATLEGVVNPQGHQTGYYFNYGTTLSYGQKTTEKGVGEGISDINVSEPLTGLSPATTYHFQVVAKSTTATASGADQTFTTLAASPPPPPLQPPPLLPPGPSGAPPDTKITLKPAAKTRDRTPTIKFSTTAGGAKYLCSVDSKPFKACRSPFTAPSLKPGRHKIRVKAVAGGVADPTPATVSFKVVA